MIDIKAIIGQYSQGEYPVIRTFSDGSGRVVIGDAVDHETNTLYYVIKNGEEITIEIAENQPVSFTLLKPTTNPAVKVK